jgi:hypothetical protein
MAEALQEEWDSYCLNIGLSTPHALPHTSAEPSVQPDPISETPEAPEAPEASELYISTKTKIVYLTTDTVDLDATFWRLSVMQYDTRADGVIKKQMKVTLSDQATLPHMADHLASTPSHKTSIIKGTPSSASKASPCVLKVNVGLCKKDIMSQRNKEKGAFYNCFMLVLRVLHEGVFREVNLKVFNTGKLSFPGMLSPGLLEKSLHLVCALLTPPSEPAAAATAIVGYIPDSIDTVLVNSNFNCGFYIDRDCLVNVLKYERKLHVSYDPCSYPGIQCKFFIPAVRERADELGDGVCRCATSCATRRGSASCSEVSFMVFRTGSVLIVGRCDEVTLRAVYEWLKRMLASYYGVISVATPTPKKQPQRLRPRKTKTLVIECDCQEPRSGGLPV